jgi:hypothetical protein
MTVNHIFYKNCLLQWLEDTVHQERLKLLDELISYSTDPVRHHRRYRMLQQLNQLHAQLIDKVHQFDTDDVNDYLDTSILNADIAAVVSRNA